MPGKTPCAPWRAAALCLAGAAQLASAQALPMTREGLDSALAQYFAGADRDHDGRIDRGEAAAALGFARSVLAGQREDEPFTIELAPDGRPRLSLNEKGPLGSGGVLDMLFRRTDRDGDGALSLGEVQAAGRERFDAVDADHDGILDEGERKTAQARLDALRRALGGR
jgi:hypothetical protein